MGFFIHGAFISCETRPDGSTYILVACGTDAYRIKLCNVDSAFFSGFSIGDLVTVGIRPIVYNGKLYLSGDNILKGGNPYGEC